MTTDSTATMSGLEYEFVRSLVYRLSGNVIDEDKSYLIDSRLGRLAEAKGFARPEDLIARLRSEPVNELHRETVEALLITETYFFRDVWLFDALKETVLPDLILKRMGERRLKIWSAACSTGQEIYSVAMLLREHFPELTSWTLELTGGDFSRPNLARAREGKYCQLEVNRGLPAPLLVKYFKQDGLSWEVSEELRRTVDFHEINLAEPWPVLPQMDIILMRNVLIYLDDATRKNALAELSELLKPDGYLFLGGAETTINLNTSFQRVPANGGSCYRLC